MPVTFSTSYLVALPTDDYIINLISSEHRGKRLKCPHPAYTVNITSPAQATLKMAVKNFLQRCITFYNRMPLDRLIQKVSCFATPADLSLQQKR